MIEQRALGRDNIAHGDIGKPGPIGFARRGIDARRIGRSVSGPQHVRTDDKETVGIDRLAGTDDFVPASFSRRSQGIDHLRTAGVAMSDQHHVVAIRRKNAQRPIGDGHGRHDHPALQPEISGDKGLYVSRRNWCRHLPEPNERGISARERSKCKTALKFTPSCIDSSTSSRRALRRDESIDSGQMGIVADRVICSTMPIWADRSVSSRGRCQPN